jgi:hypothetical protein
LQYVCGFFRFTTFTQGLSLILFCTYSCETQKFLATYKISLRLCVYLSGRQANQFTMLPDVTQLQIYNQVRERINKGVGVKIPPTYRRTAHVPLVNTNNKCGTKERQVKITSDRFYITVACTQSGHGCWSDGWRKIRFHSFYYPTKN